MKRFVPPRPTGSTREARFMQAIWDACFGPESKDNDSSTIKVRKTSKGKFWDAVVRPSGGNSPQSPTKEMRLKTVYGDHLDCCEIGDTGLTGPTTPVAREARCRRSITTETLPKTDGSGNVVITYTYAAITGFLDQRRKASATGYPDQLEIITPIYLSGEIISVIPIASVTLDGVACVWKETNERYWTQYA